MSTKHSLSELVRPSMIQALRFSAIAALLTTGALVARAQAPLQSPNTPQTVADTTPAFSSSSAEQAQPANTTEASLSPLPAVNFANYMQYGGGQRRRYAQPRYRGSNTTADGTPKYTFFAGVGFQQPIGNTFHYLTPSYGIQFGGGRNFDRHVGVMAQFDYDHFGFAGETLSNQTAIYNAPTVGGAGSVSGLDGSSHVWSFTLDPVYNLYQSNSWGAYAVGGVGFFHKTANFTVPGTGVYCDPYYGCYQYSANQTIDKYTSNAPGFDGGFGITYKFSRFSNERFYGEVRYVVVLNSQRQGITLNNLSSVTATTTNFYPANSNRTTYIPVKFGIRF